MLSFSLDTNCIISLEETRANPASQRASKAKAVEALLNAHAAGTAHVAVVAISASERQRDGGRLGNFSTFQQRLNTLGLGHLDLLHPMMYFDVTFWDASLWSDDSMQAFERAIHEILFPNDPFLWIDYCATNGLDPSSGTPDTKWKNLKCDVQALWSHAWRKRDVFVTSDKDFLAESKKRKLMELAGGRIETPESAAILAGVPKT